MRIFSKQKDYYDSALAYGVDNNVFFKRKTEEIIFDSKVLRFGHLGDGCTIFNSFSSETKKIIETINNITPNLSVGYRNDFNINNVFFGVEYC